MTEMWGEDMRVAQMQLEPFSAQVALHLIKRNMEVIRLQFKRIRHDNQALKNLLAAAEERWQDQDFQTDRQETHTALFADIHFLLIYLQQLDLLLGLLERNLPEDAELKSVRMKYGGMLKDANDFRNHLEHIDDRVERGVSDLGNLADSEFTFDGKTFDIGPRREQHVEGFFEDLMVACEAISQRQRS